MINKDYILRLAERLGRFLARIIFLQETDQNEEALILIDEAFRQALGLTSGLINSLPEETLLAMLSPNDVFNVELCFYVAALLKAEGDVYANLEKQDESYYRHLKALNLFLELFLRGKSLDGLDLFPNIDDLVGKLEEYELPLTTNLKLFRYYEKAGRYAKAEDMLFDMLEAEPRPDSLVTEGIDFYQRLLAKSDAELLLGNLSRDELAEGLAQVQEMQD
ncbi:MAG TPA: DUF6483 family protein [Ktedonobacteraceae bacterium]|nr:DUF6483 family protein [Ktedonobacteraceae bacterium]